MKILIVDDHAIVRKGLVDLLKEEFNTAEFSLASNSEEAIYMSMNDQWDLILLDITLPGRSGLETLKQLRSNNIKAPILMLSMLPESQYAMRALKAGASGYVNKDSATEDLVNAVYKVLSGRKYLSEKLADRFLDIIDKKKNSSSLELLSDRELEVMKMIAAGESLSTIAELMSLSISTISTYRLRLLQKLHIKNNADIIRYFIEK